MLREFRLVSFQHIHFRYTYTLSGGIFQLKLTERNNEINSSNEFLIIFHEILC